VKGYVAPEFSNKNASPVENLLRSCYFARFASKNPASSEFVRAGPDWRLIFLSSLVSRLKFRVPSFASMDHG